MFSLIPFEREQSDLFHYLDNLERNFFGGMQNQPAAFRTDIVEQDSSYLLQAELPGFNKEDITIDINDNMLTITAAHKESNEVKKENYIRRERRYGSFTRSFDVTNINTAAIKAAYNNGILELTLPKAVPAEPQPTRISIQ